MLVSTILNYALILMIISGLPFGNMVTIRYVIVCLLTLLCGWLNLTQPAQAVEPGTKLTAVTVSAPELLRELIAKHFALPEQLPETQGARAALLRRAQQDIPSLLATEGFFSSKVIMHAGENSGVLELEVIPGPRTLVTTVTIEFRGDLALPEARNVERVQELRAAWLLHTGQPFRADAWDEAKANLLAQVAGKDYAAARLVDSAAKVDVDTASAELKVVVDSGGRFLFGELQVSGLERYDENLVTRYALFKSGQPYDRELLMAFQNRLQNLPQFSTVMVNFDAGLESTPSETSSGAVTIPVIVKIVEAQSRRISLGIGYSSNNGVRDQINYQSYNFLNQAWSLSGAWVFEQNRQTLSVGLVTPPNPHGYQLAWAGSGEKTQIQGLDTIRDKFGVIRSRNQYGIDTGIGLSLQQEQRLPLGGIRETDQALVLDWYWIRRVVDNPLFPMSGNLTELRLGGASQSVLSDQDFVRNYFRHQTWIPVSENDVVTLRIEAGYTAATTRLGIPQEYLFRVGGTQTVRGFEYQSLGFREGNAVVGARVMATSSAEYTHWFNNWGAALFTDVGGAADIAPDLRMSLGYGIGARWRSPVGPLALDWARGRGQVDSRFHFSIAVAF